MSDVLSLVAGVVTAIVTARWLGPAGRGAYSTLAYLAAVGATVAVAGLGEAVVIAIERDGMSRARALGATLGLLILSSTVVVPLVTLVGYHMVTTVPVAAVLIGVLTVQTALTSAIAGALNASGRIAAVSVILAVGTWSTAIFVAGGLAFVGTNVGVALAGTAAGAMVAVVALARQVARMGIVAVPRWDAAFARQYGPVGAGFAGASLLVSLTGRLDLVVVFQMIDSAAAGQYSIALTAGGLGAMVPLAIGYAAFPRLSGLASDEVRSFALTTTRASVAAASVTALLLSIGWPWAIPFVLGVEYRPAVVPAIVLTLGSVPVSVQWLVCRARASRGSTRIMVNSYAVSLTSMMILDVLLIPLFGLAGAAAAAFIAPTLGSVVAMRSQGGEEEVGPFHPAELRPRPSDFTVLFKRIRGERT